MTFWTAKYFLSFFGQQDRGADNFMSRGVDTNKMLNASLLFQKENQLRALYVLRDKIVEWQSEDRQYLSLGQDFYQWRYLTFISS